MQTSDTMAISGDRDLQVRIRAEYQEMPGLRLTLPQAARLAAGSFVRGSA